MGVIDREYFGAKPILAAPELRDLGLSEQDARALLRLGVIDADVIDVNGSSVYRTTASRLARCVAELPRRASRPRRVHVDRPQLRRRKVAA